MDKKRKRPRTVVIDERPAHGVAAHLAAPPVDVAERKLIARMLLSQGDNLKRHVFVGLSRRHANIALFWRLALHLFFPMALPRSETTKCGSEFVRQAERGRRTRCHLDSRGARCTGVRNDAGPLSQRLVSVRPLVCHKVRTEDSQRRTLPVTLNG